MTAKIVIFSVETHIHIVKLQNQLSSKYPTFFLFAKIFNAHATNIDAKVIKLDSIIPL